MSAILPFFEARRAFEKAYVRRVLKLTKGNVSEAARIAVKDRKDFYEVMKRNDVDPEAFRPKSRRTYFKRR